MPVFCSRPSPYKTRLSALVIEVQVPTLSTALQAFDVLIYVAEMAPEAEEAGSTVARRSIYRPDELLLNCC